MMDSLAPPLNAGATAPVIAIVIPVFNHSVLIAEAVKSALAQDCNEAFSIVLVNDGCALEETHQVCLGFAALYPQTITYLRRPNGGLSAARNTGIRFALRRWPGLAAVYLLDADNRLLPAALRRAYSRLQSDLEFAWVYPNIDMFGIGGNYDFDGPYSLLVHTRENICEAGSLIARSVFDAGIWFDESMRSGYEDWDFWLQAAGRGLRGQNEPLMGLQYRRRAESMLAEAGRVHDDIKSHMKRKHSWMFEPKGVARLEAEHAPRYAIYIADTGQFLFTTDPAASDARMALEEIDLLFWRAEAAPHQAHFPPFIVTITSQTLILLRRAGMLRWAFWALEQSLNQASVAALRLGHHGVKHTIEVTEDIGPAARATLTPCTMLMIPTRGFQASLRDEAPFVLDGMDGVAPTISAAITAIALDNPAALHVRGGGPRHLLSLLNLLRDSAYREAALAGWDWRCSQMRPRRDNFEFLRDAIGGDAAAYPFAGKSGRNVGFLLPIMAFGGVEKVAYNVARELKSGGWQVHLFVLGSGTAELPPSFAALFESINFLLDPGSSRFGAGRSFLGAPLPLWEHGHKHAQALGLLYWLDAVINCHSAGANALMGQLRRFGLRTINHLHVIDRSPLQMPTGHPMISLAYEHAYDKIICCSNTLARWMHGMGVPEKKLLVVPNGPGFAISAADAAAAITQRDSRGGPLRAAYIGRLDRQKGLHRLAEIVRQTKTMTPAVAWRIIGRSVLRDDEACLRTLEPMIEPPVVSDKAMLARLGWAHVLVLPSHWEGMPLVVIEAMHCGTVVIATDTGAVREIIEDGVTGFLVPNDGAAAEACSRVIRLLANDRALWKSVSAAALAASAKFSWRKSVTPLIAYLESHELAADARARSGD